MSRPRKADAMTSAERVRRYRERQKAVTKTQNSALYVTETPDESFCEWFPWAKGCSLDVMQRSSFNVVRPGHPRFEFKCDPAKFFPKLPPALQVVS